MQTENLSITQVFSIDRAGVLTCVLETCGHYPAQGLLTLREKKHKSPLFTLCPNSVTMKRQKKDNKGLTMEPNLEFVKEISLQAGQILQSFVGHEMGVQHKGGIRLLVHRRCWLGYWP